MSKSQLVKPKPIKGFKRKKVIYIPVDSPTGTIHRIINNHTLKTRKTLFGEIVLLKDKILLLQCISSPLAVISLERLIASGAEEIMMLGFCGALKSGAKVGDPVIITRAFSEEGTSQHYFLRKQSFSSSPSLQNRMEAMMNSQGLAFSRHSVVTTDAPFRETRDWLKDKQDRNIGFVDMEASAVFALAKFYGLEAAALMLVSDILTEDKHKIGFFNPRLLGNIKKYFSPFILEEEKE